MSIVRDFRRSALGAAVVAALLAGLAGWLDSDFYLRILFMCGVYYLCAAGTNVLAGYAGQKSLGQAGLFAAGAYTVALLTTSAGWHPALALAAAPVVAALVGVLIALPSLRVKGPSLALVTLAFGIVAQKLVTEWTDMFGGAQGIYGIVPLNALNGEAYTLQHWVWLVIALGLVAHLVLLHLLRGKFGRALLSLQLDEIAASCAGISVYRYKTLAFVIAAALCGLGGALVAQQNQYFNSDFITFHLSVFILLLVLLGGAGTIHGPLVGAIVLTLTDVYLAQWPFAQHFVYGAMLLFALYLMPEGVVGLFRRRKTTGTAMVASTATSTVNAASVNAPVDATGTRPASVDTGALRSALTRDAIDTVAPLLELRDIHKAFGGIVTARGINLVLQAHRIHALIGPNGAGKSTLINIITGVIPASAGTVLLQGRDITTASAHVRAAAGVVRTFQNLRLFGAMTVLENVIVGAHSRIQGTHREADALRNARAVLEFTDLADYAGARAGSLPYGVQRRVELARALASQPLLLLLDEPAAGLNPQETRELGQLVRKIGALGIAVLMVEHDMSLVMEVSDHIVVLDNGTLIAEGGPAAIQADPKVIAAYLGSDELIIEEAAA
ncbi:branched-chain amino acid ABC transporter ATP-binding protein/permease [Achromobacter aloeverae]|uniref:ABC transporter ATP-binding protein n=1 Tax=Achromobacter aloeverae TaxID=1750518 RepID=A0A4Q1HE96_9BURK|nr:branched-chain amino acid ABC transporter ATP-binding protein/permease [Achromobacter aloeverae]RXN84636.1 ABC transporter ATP-binding protein [Achromobacter aloeverae]